MKVRVYSLSRTIFQLSRSAMSRGIHLKQIKSADLQAIGMPNDRLGETADDENGWPFSRLAEIDLVLAQTLTEVRQGLEATLSLLDEVLAVNSPTQTQPLNHVERRIMVRSHPPSLTASKAPRWQTIYSHRKKREGPT